MVLNDVPLGEAKAIPRTCVVLNGRGFLGRSLVSSLLKLDDWIVRVADSAHSLLLDSSDSDSLLSDSLSSARVHYHQVDVRDVSQIKTGILTFHLLLYLYLYKCVIYVSKLLVDQRMRKRRQISMYFEKSDCRPEIGKKSLNL